MKLSSMHIPSIIRIVLFVCFFAQAEDVDLIIYSYDRPMQLYALLESLDVYTQHLGSVQVIYLVSDNKYEVGYQKVWQQFPQVKVLKQGASPKSDFKPLTMQALGACQNDYMLFAVDDIIVKDHIDFDDCISQMKKHNAYGFYLRLGKHLTHCYTMSRAQCVPRFIKDDASICLWQFAQGQLDWGYPHTVDMAIYSRRRVQKQLDQIPFSSPNYLEGRWAGNARPIMGQYGICYADTKIVNLPLNRVQNTHGNKHMHLMTAAELLSIFMQGKKIDITPLYKIKNKAAHMEYEPSYVAREK